RGLRALDPRRRRARRGARGEAARVAGEEREQARTVGGPGSDPFTRPERLRPAPRSFLSAGLSPQPKRLGFTLWAPECRCGGAQEKRPAVLVAPGTDVPGA